MKIPAVQTWRAALKHNRVVNKIDHLKRDHLWRITDSPEYNFSTAAPDAPFSVETKAFCAPFIRFIRAEQGHREAEETRQGFAKVAALRHSSPRYFYFLRYSDEHYLFGEEAAELGFSKSRGLDVGCLSSGCPHYQYYERRLEMEMWGIDTQLEPAWQNERVLRADVKNLPFENDYFGFATVAMIFGLGRPSDTVLEIAAGLSELYRTVRGFVYLADRYVMPEVVFIAQQLGFRCFFVPWKSVSPWRRQLFPMGTYLVKGDTPFEQNIYPALMGALTVAGMEIAYSPEDRDLSLPIRLLK